MQCSHFCSESDPSLRVDNLLRGGSSKSCLKTIFDIQLPAQWRQQHFKAENQTLRFKSHWVFFYIIWTPYTQKLSKTLIAEERQTPPGLLNPLKWPGLATSIIKHCLAKHTVRTDNVTANQVSTCWLKSLGHWTESKAHHSKWTNFFSWHHQTWTKPFRVTSCHCKFWICHGRNFDSKRQAISQTK
jgi:hypothetical protein